MKYPDIGVAYNSPAEISVKISGNRFKWFLAAILPWKKHIVIHAEGAGIFINAPSKENRK